MEQPGESSLETFLLDSAERGRRNWRLLPRLLAVTLPVLLLFGWYWSLEPEPLALAALPAEAREARVPGAASTAMLAAIVDALLDKPGGYLHNDRLPPGVLLDDMPSFEAGMLAHVRDMTRALRRDFGRAPQLAVEDPDLARAEARFHFDADSWLLPTSEGEYAIGREALDSYYLRLVAPQPGARFHAEPDALARWLADVDSRLAAYGQRLAAATAEGEARTPWLARDDSFYEARGYAWALRAQLRAVQVDFAAALASRGAMPAVAQAVTALEGSQRPVLSPVILNGSEFGLLANHSLVMANYLARARASLMQARLQLATPL